MDKKTILVIDDTPSNLILLNNLLCRDYRVKVANGGGKGIKLALADNAPDLILLDVLMPELDVFAVCDVLKKNRKTQHIPVMFLSTLYEPLNQYKVVLEVDPAHARDPSALAAVRVATAGGGLAPLPSFARVEQGTMPLSIAHVGGQVSSTISFGVIPSIPGALLMRVPPA